MIEDQAGRALLQEAFVLKGFKHLPWAVAAMPESATELLKEDHRVIERVLNSLEDLVSEIEEGAEVPVQLIKDLIQFSQAFVDRCHHGKEEMCLFPCLERRGIPKVGGPIGVMLYEHQVGRELVKKIGDALLSYGENPEAGWALASVFTQYVAHLRQHIFKEENILFRMGDGVMSPIDHEDSVECYEKTEEERVGAGKHEEMLNLAKKLERAH